MLTVIPLHLKKVFQCEAVELESLSKVDFLGTPSFENTWLLNEFAKFFQSTSLYVNTRATRFHDVTILNKTVSFEALCGERR